MKFYVASKFENYKQVMELEDFIRNQGHMITFSWAKEAAVPVLEGFGGELPVSSKFLEKCCDDDTQGVKTCNTLILLSNPEFPNMYGALIEVGMALTFNKNLWVVGPTPDTPFFHQPRVRFFGDAYEVKREIEGIL